jgi:putative peptide modification system cyclase
MNAQASPTLRPPVGSPVTPLLRAVLLADLVDSTAFVAGFGDERAARALQRLDLQIRDLLEFTGGRLIDKADGLLALFERPIQAVDFALRYQQAMRQFSEDEGVRLSARVGIHVGELMTWSNTDQAVLAGAKPLEVEGLAKPMAARLMGLCLPGQVLVSSMAQALAQRAQAELGERAERVRWIAHGRYRFKGMPAPVLVHEVGEEGFAPLRQPPSGAKAWRDVPFWRRPPVLFAEALVLVAVVGFFAFTLLRSLPAIAFQERDWVVVGDLSNFTGDQRLDDSLETALRISLEQSRYVNVMPQIKVQSVLARMGRSGNTTIDRAVGSEIAMREGARVLLLPSVAEVGGRLRFSLEVVDPSTQETVYADSAEGRGIASALTSVDRVNTRLREKLGEATAQIKADGRPLAQITTPSLEALRLYTLANEASIRDLRLGESVRLLNLAIDEDPDFAMAYSARARQHLANSDMARARADFAIASRYRNRLSTREALALDTGIAELGPVLPRLQAWQAVARVYPDLYRSYFKIAENRAFYLQQYQRALDDLAPALTPKNQRLASVLNLSGIFHLGLEHYAESRAAFERAESLGTHDPVRYHADTEAVLRNYEASQRLLARQAPTGAPGFDMDNRLPEITYPVDQGKLEAGIAAARALAEARVDAPVQKRIYRGTWLGLRSVTEGKAVLPQLRAVVAEELDRARVPDHPDRLTSTQTALYLGSLAASLGDRATAQAVLDALSPHVPELGYPAADDLLAVLRAELALQQGQPAAAIEGLRARLDGGELNWVHGVLSRAYEQAGRLADARREAEWLGQHRGRAFVEYGNQSQLQPWNVLQSNLAWLRVAELSRRGGDEAGARAALARFDLAWPVPPAVVAPRQAAVQAFLTQRKGRTDRTARL